jgi:Ni/Co efflux regulator RcnB/surface antigen
MKRMLTAVLALSLLNGTAIMAQPNNPNRGNQSDNRNDAKDNDQRGNDRKGNDQKGTRAAPAARGAQGAPGRAAPAAQAAPATQAAPERAAAPAARTRTAAPAQGARNRDATAARNAQAGRDRDAAAARNAQAGRDRDAAAARNARGTRDRDAAAARNAQASRDRDAATARRTQEQDRVRELQSSPNVRVATPRWSRGDRIPNQYRQNQYVMGDWQQHGLRQPPRGYHWVRDDNNDFFLALIATGMISDVVYRNDRDQLWRQHYSRYYTYDDDIYYQQCRTSPDPAGVIAGALIGGLLGNAAGRGNGGATIAGVIFGGAVGAALTNDLDCEDRSYAYRTYYDGFNSGRPGSRFEWRNPRNDHRGEFLLGNYYNDPYGFRCANFSQAIYIQGRPQEARGVACRQPDGTWAIVS